MFLLLPYFNGSFLFDFVQKVHFHASFRRRRHYVFGLYVRPSVRSLKYPFLTCTWVPWSTRPTVAVLRHVRPSVRLSVCPSIELSGYFQENAWREGPGLKFCTLMYLDHLQNRLVYDFSNFGTILT